jgi:hypothetical protein
LWNRILQIFGNSFLREENNRQLSTNRDASPSAGNSKFKIEVPKIELPKGGGAIIAPDLK